MQRTHHSTHMRKYRCDNRCCVDFINITKLFVSLYNRFDVSNLLNLKFRQSKFDSRFLQIFEFWIFYTRFLLNIEVSWNNKTMCLKHVWCIRIDLKKHYNRDFRIWKFWNLKNHYDRDFRIRNFSSRFIFNLR